MRIRQGTLVARKRKHSVTRIARGMTDFSSDIFVLLLAVAPPRIRDLSVKADPAIRP
jgi:hypothetical protein